MPIKKCDIISSLVIIGEKERLLAYLVPAREGLGSLLECLRARLYLFAGGLKY